MPSFRCREDPDRARRVASRDDARARAGQGDCKRVRHRRLDLEYELQRRRLRLAARSTHDSLPTMCTARQRRTRRGPTAMQSTAGAGERATTTSIASGTAPDHHISANDVPFVNVDAGGRARRASTAVRSTTGAGVRATTTSIATRAVAHHCLDANDERLCGDAPTSEASVNGEAIDYRCSSACYSDFYCITRHARSPPRYRQ